MQPYTKYLLRLRGRGSTPVSFTRPDVKGAEFRFFTRPVGSRVEDWTTFFFSFIFFVVAIWLQSIYTCTDVVSGAKCNICFTTIQLADVLFNSFAHI